MTEINIVPLSVNRVWQGKRFKTPAYKKYESVMMLMLPKKVLLPPPFRIDIHFGFSSTLSDIDNPLKPLLDILQKKYSIDDKDIFELNVKKSIVKKGAEYIKFDISYV